MSSPGVNPACSMASTSSCTASSFEPQVRGEAALVADRGGQAPVVEHRLEHVVRLGAPAQRLGEAGGADRHDHELLEVDVVVGVRAAVEHVHHRHRQHVGVGAADVAVQRQRRARRPPPWPRPATTPRMALAPSRALLSVPSRSISAWSSTRWSSASKPVSASRISPFDVGDGGRARPCRRTVLRRRAARPLRTARSTRPRALRHDRRAPESSTTSTSTVGLPRESRICRARDVLDAAHVPAVAPVDGGVNVTQVSQGARSTSPVDDTPAGIPGT